MQLTEFLNKMLIMIGALVFIMTFILLIPNLDLLFSAMVAISTVVYAILTYKLVNETKKVRESQIAPHITVTYSPREEWINLIDFIIKNDGMGSAYNINFEMITDPKYFKENKLSELNLIKNGLKFLAKSQEIRFFLTSLNYEPEAAEKPIKIKVTYSDSLNNKFSEIFILDFSEIYGMSQLGEPPLYKIAKSLDSIQSDLHSFTTGFSKTKTIVYTPADIKKEYEEIMNRNKNIVTKKKKTPK